MAMYIGAHLCILATALCEAFDEKSVKPAWRPA